MSGSTIAIAVVLIVFVLLGLNGRGDTTRDRSRNDDGLFDIADFISSFFDRK